jgi:Skp family chaperone for outer membrane proteins
MTKKLNFVLAAVAAILVTGCGGSKDTGKVAILDMDVIASDLDMNAELDQLLQQKQTEVDDQLRQLRTNLQQQLSEKQRQIGDNPTDKQRQEMLDIMQNAERIYQTEMNKARQTMAQHRAKVISDFHDKVRPFAAEVAKKQGFTVVMLKSEPVYYVDAAADITAAVSAKMQGTNIKIADAAPEVSAPPAAPEAPQEPAEE